MEFYRRVLVGYDGSDNSDRALERAMKIAKQSSAKLIILVVYTSIVFSYSPAPGLYKQYDKAAASNSQRLAGSARDKAKSFGLDDIVASHENGVPAEMILSSAEEWGADLIVLGRRGMTQFKRLLMGSVSSAVLNNAKCDALIVK